MAHDLLTRESPEIIRFFQDIGHITELLKSKPDRYRPVLNGDRYITEAELSESLKITRRTLVEHRTQPDLSPITGWEAGYFIKKRIL